MKTKTLIGLVIVLAAIIGIGAYCYFVLPKTSGGVKETPNPGQEYSIENKTISEEADKYGIAVDYPQISGYPGKEEGFNTIINGFVQQEIYSFKEPFGSPDTSNLPEEDAGMKSSMGINYEIKESSKDFVSVLFNESEYLPGQAHPNSWMMTINYDFLLGRGVYLEDLFKNGSDYLTVLSDYAAQDLINQIKNGQYDSDEQFVREGTKPTAENFSVFTVEKEGLVIHFNNYQVGPYSAGQAEVVVPYSLLESIAAENGLLVKAASL